MNIRSENEKYFQDPTTKSRKLFPSLNDSYSKYLSVIIPAYKEVDRCKRKNYSIIFSHILNNTCFRLFILVPAMIKETMDYLEQRQVYTRTTKTCYIYFLLGKNFIIYL